MTNIDLRLSTIVPTGIIVLWSGAIADIPTGWALCDGQSSDTITIPDLSHKFILSYSVNNSIGDTGGSHNKTLSTNHIPQHSHNINVNNVAAQTINGGSNNAGSHSHRCFGNYGVKMSNHHGDMNTELSIPHGGAAASSFINDLNTHGAGSHSHTINVNNFSAVNINAQCGNVGNTAEFSIMPSYYILAFIIKL
jgi:microcystin-dependent protein